ncbi:MAG: Ribonucleoside-diphosphate reductase [Thermotoga sp. 50_1627]|uniref:adenosylcobalamin-dependent ribonucleoside-diphosphate reductase n=1 Tax=Pseudothermotoga sp. TaxID=2033661 RepID=UPI00076D95F0|nr:MAG: Ribonucleoside-diphosphate reductase [Thermotoga sp. 50_64]KUK25757.1 MAG: Ribonucleoside-diphosphate reductase [Thermotoga sp. 50_1627]MBC7115441.1 adenosylcobalamin-dependent ribonucleoside-diphosphate reductase [Pseudothermotoga sp.]MDK2923961.1 ribonucleoside-diphosphate reductase alpha chain [Pseudothermotoga sp.]HBT40141.1 adenosylcobalamin-dependent ribonucleoside-diphosphate reductase [Pseudothermotoga sp.]
MHELVKKWQNVPPSQNAEKILRERYYLKNREGEYLENSWSELSRRVARVIAAAELLNNPHLQQLTPAERLDHIKSWEETFYELISSRIFIPNSPTLFNAGMGVDFELLYKPLESMKLEDYEKIVQQRNHLHMLSACFVVPVDDSIDGIFTAVKEYAMITKVGGGIGSNFSALRPNGSFVAGTHGKASGPISFMHVFNSAVSVVEQGYRRRGALMGILNIDHPDIVDFIQAKRGNDGERVLRFFNISVGIPMQREEILRLYEQDGQIELHHPKWTGNKQVRVREIFKLMAQNAWETGDPGMVFLGEMNKYYALYPVRQIVSTNPCGEIGLGPYEACNLGSIDVAKLYDGEKFSWDALEKIVRVAVRFLDNVIDVNVFPIDKIERAVKESRRLGLGIMGFADLLYQMEIPYDSEEARRFARNLMAFISLHAHEASSDLGEEKGNFPLFSQSRYVREENFVPFSMDVSDYDDEIRQHFKTRARKHKRNVAVLAIAPTGSISNIADTSSGLEPNFLLAYVRYVNKQSSNEREPLLYINEVLKKKMPAEDLKRIESELIEKGSLKDLDVDKKWKRIFVVALDISPMDHLLMQEAFQCYVDNNISKTINMPNSASVDDVLEIYVEALKHKIRGLTIYRDGSLRTQVLTTARSAQKKEAKLQFFIVDEKHKLRPRPRKETLRSVTRKYRASDGTTYITVSFDDNGEAIEIFLSNGTETAEAIGRLCSIALRAGVSPDEIIEQLTKVKGEYVRNVGLEIKKAIEDFCSLWPSTQQNDSWDGTIKSAEEIERFVQANKLEWQEGYYVDSSGNVYCPSCLSKNSLFKQEGCIACRSCGWSKCS